MGKEMQREIVDAEIIALVEDGIGDNCRKAAAEMTLNSQARLAWALLIVDQSEEFVAQPSRALYKGVASTVVDLLGVTMSRAKQIAAHMSQKKWVQTSPHGQQSARVLVPGELEALYLQLIHYNPMDDDVRGLVSDSILVEVALDDTIKLVEAVRAVLATVPDSSLRKFGAALDELLRKDYSAEVALRLMVETIATLP